MASTEDEKKKAITNTMDVSQGEIANTMDVSKGAVVSVRSEATTMYAMPGSTVVFGNVGTVNQCQYQGHPKRVIEPYTKKDIRKLKDMYNIQHQTHYIHVVDITRKIVLKEIDINEFAVKLKITDTMRYLDTFRDETRRHFEHLKRIPGMDIELSELIDSKNRVTFIRGIAGMGKSVLSQQLAYGWANAEMYTDFKVCIMFECRDINSFVLNEGKEYKESEKFGEFVKAKFNFDLGDGEDILFIVDGLDELYDINTNDSIIWQLLDIKTTEYTRSRIILTGRPHIENRLLRPDKKTRGIRKVEIQGLCEVQIQEYINKFASCEDDISNISKAKNSSRRHLPIIHVPQFLNSFCCVAVLSEGKTIRNAAELYCWTLYLHLKQHADKQGSCEKKSSEIFDKYSLDLVVLCNICHKLLNENTIVFEGNIESQFFKSGKGREFLEGLFVDVSDNRSEKYQFKHLTLMEFLSAVHICRVENYMEIIDVMVMNEFYDLLIFTCQLISGCKYDGIINDMFVDSAEIKEINVQQFLPDVLTLLRKHIVTAEERSFQLSIEVIMCFMNKDIASKEFIISNINTLHCNAYILQPESIKKVSEISENLVNEYKCNDEDIKEAFKNIPVQNLRIYDFSILPCIRYFTNVNLIQMWDIKAIGTISAIRQEVSQCVNYEKVEIKSCMFEDEDANDRRTNSKFKSLDMHSCKLNKKSFINLCNWVTSSVEDFQISSMAIEVDWWEELVDAILKAKEKGSRVMTLQRLYIDSCTSSNMSKDLEIQECKYSVNAIKEAFKTILVEIVHIDDISSLPCLKYLANVQLIRIQNVKTNGAISAIRKEIDQCVNCEKVEFLECVFRDENLVERTPNSMFKSLEINGCSMNKQSFINVCNWAAASFEEFELSGLTVDFDFWQEFVDAIVKTKKKSNGEMILRKLDIEIPKMSKYMEMKKYKYSENDIKEALRNFLVEKVRITEAMSLPCLKYLENVKSITIWKMIANGTICAIRKEVDHCLDCKKVEILSCIFKDEDLDERKTNSMLKSLEMINCIVSRKSFINLSNWAASSVEVLSLSQIKIEADWWQELVFAIVKEKSIGNVTLKKLKVDMYTSKMSKDMKLQIVNCGVELKIDGKIVAPLHPVHSLTSTSSSNACSTHKLKIGRKRKHGKNGK